MTIVGTTEEPVHPRAVRWQVMICGGEECRHPHLVLFDDQDKIIADAVISRTAIDYLAARLHDAVKQIDANFIHSIHPRRPNQ